MPSLLDTGMSKRGWSYYGTARRCLRMFFYKFRANLPDGVSGGARGLGALIHAMLAWRYMVRMGLNVPTLDEVVESSAEDRGVPAKDVQLSREVYAHYEMTHAGEIGAPIGVETEFRVAFSPRPDGGVDVVAFDEAKSPAQGEEIKPGDHVLYTARIDLVTQYPDGAIWFWDHKTAAWFKNETNVRYSMSGQMHGLHTIGKAVYGEPPFAGVALNMIKTRSGREVQHKRLLPAPRMVEDFPGLILTTAWQIAKCDSMFGMNERLWPCAAHEMVCCSSYGMCEYADRCKMG